MDQDFSITTRGAGGQGKLDVKITAPSHRPIPSKLESGTANEVHTVKYIPPEEGPYRVDISYDGNPVPGSPFTVEGLMPPDPSKVRSHPNISPQNSENFLINSNKNPKRSTGSFISVRICSPNPITCISYRKNIETKTVRD